MPKETCFYKVSFVHHSSISFAFDDHNATEIVEAPKNIYWDDMDNLCRSHIPGFRRLNNYKEVFVRKLV